jgi:putative redox protein
MYAQRKGWPLRGVSTRLRHARIHAEDCAECETKEGKLDHIELEIGLEGPLLSDEQRTKLLEIAEKCPVHRTLVTENIINIRVA